VDKHFEPGPQGPKSSTQDKRFKPDTQRPNSISMDKHFELGPRRTPQRPDSITGDKRFTRDKRFELGLRHPGRDCSLSLAHFSGGR
jgi:hypothetical protein